MNHPSISLRRTVSFRAAVVVASLLSAATLEAQETNNPPPVPSVPRDVFPELDDVTVKQVRISPGIVQHSGAGGQGPVSLDAPGSTFSASVPLPAGTTTSNRNEFVAAPIPFFSPSIGFGLGLGAAYLYNPTVAETKASPWVTGAGGFYSNNGSWGAGAAHKMNWDEDRWRLLGVAAYANLRYDFFGVGDGAGEAEHLGGEGGDQDRDIDVVPDRLASGDACEIAGPDRERHQSASVALLIQAPS